MGVLTFLRNWTLPIAMLAGVAGYFIYDSLPFIDPFRPFVGHAVGVMQPALIFMMLFLTFCRIRPKELHLSRWHLWLLLFQSAAFSLISVILMTMPQSGLRVILEGAMICLICPTATAAAVVTGKLGGSPASVTTYTILINLAAAVLIPAFVPFVHPNPDMSAVNSFSMIIGKVFPLLLMPFVAAVLVRFLFPKLHAFIIRFKDLSFYLWAVALALAIAATVKSMMHTDVGVSTQIWLAVVSLICCVIQFLLGRKVGMKYGDPVTAGQALGQKNTVLAIWLGYMFFTPVTALVGGFYSIWHNVANSYQLYLQRKKDAAGER